MERVRLIYEQIEEARKYILAGSLLQLRLALILLDNAVELMMYRELEDEFMREDYRRPKWQPGLDEWLKEGLGPKYTDEERRQAEKEFEPKARILQFRLGRITTDERNIICICHKIRCEAFHREHLRPEILLPVCRLLYAIAAELTVKLRFKYYSRSLPDDKDNTAFLERFGIDDRTTSLHSDECLNHLRQVLVEGMDCDPQELAETLSRDLVERIDLTIGGLAYLGETEKEERIDYNLQHSQFWQERGAELMKNGMRGGDLDRAFQDWQAEGRAKFTLHKIKNWKRRASEIARHQKPALAMVQYWAIDKRFAPLEKGVSQAVFEYDERINMEIHDSR